MDVLLLWNCLVTMYPGQYATDPPERGAGEELHISDLVHSYES